LTIWNETGPDGIARLRVGGELDAHSAPEFAEAFDPAVAAGAAVEVDLTDVTFIDSSGLAALIGVRQRVLDAGGSLVVSAASHAAMRLFEIAGVSAHLMRAES
jgi:anti-sigma B factor antagonist